MAAVHDLRREVESSPLPVLSQLGQTALDLTDVICLAALEEGDVGGFRRYARIAVALGGVHGQRRSLALVARGLGLVEPPGPEA
jgi:hypothetical protein